jgi:O-antigen/teichoic acid export membrane protein
MPGGQAQGPSFHGGGVTVSSESTGTRAWRSALGLVKGERVLTHNLIVGGGTMGAGILGVAFQAVISHRLRPADFGGVFAVVTLITFIALPATAFTLLMARETSRSRATGQSASSATLLRKGNRALISIGAAVAVTLAATSPLLGRFLDVPASLLIAAAAGIPFSVALPLLLGELQGEQRFVAYSTLLFSQAALKVLGALTLGVLLGPVGIIAGISLGTAIVYAVGLSLLRKKLSIRPRLPWWRPAAAYLAVIMPSTVALAVLLSADVLLVKHYFPTRAAGEYSAVAAVGRAIFWGASGVAAVLFPKVIYRNSQGQSGFRLVGASLVLVALGGLFGLGVLSFTSTRLLTAFAGPAYSSGAGYLPWYALGMTFLGGAAVLIATHQSSGKPAFLAVLLPLTLVEPVLLVVFHQSLSQVVWMVNISSILVFVSLAALYAIQERGGHLSPAPVVEGESEPTPALPLLRVNR